MTQRKHPGIIRLHGVGQSQLELWPFDASPTGRKTQALKPLSTPRRGVPLCPMDLLTFGCLQWDMRSHDLLILVEPTTYSFSSSLFLRCGWYSPRREGREHSARLRNPWMPSYQKSAPTSPSTGSRVSAALFSRDAGEGRASLGALGSWVTAPLEVGELLPDCYSYQKPLHVFFTVQGGWFVTTRADGLVEL